MLQNFPVFADTFSFPNQPYLRGNNRLEIVILRRVTSLWNIRQNISSVKSLA